MLLNHTPMLAQITLDICKVVIVEHDEDDRWLLAEAFQLCGTIEVVAYVSDGATLLEWLASNREKLPDAILAELYLASKSGYDIVAEIGEDPVFKEIPVFLTSIIAEKAVAENCRKVGASGYLTKPVLSFEYIDYTQRLYRMITQRKKHNLIRAGNENKKKDPHFLFRM